ncbi:hypothetical protein PanWU01x14_046900 [Parasponia andersonii]|uniref:Uncharacterized protein n=1 Tax=Parasponia andersonii TaxID=3476 RepID=A0A2P5DNV6_PARAD|nr:hypothetical protein PanWU01x14_046900 [Parasponia andersonii]
MEHNRWHQVSRHSPTWDDDFNMGDFGGEDDDRPHPEVVREVEKDLVMLATSSKELEGKEPIFE